MTKTVLEHSYWIFLFNPELLFFFKQLVISFSPKEFRIVLLHRLLLKGIEIEDRVTLQ